jgi:hypothetical protein
MSNGLLGVGGFATYTVVNSVLQFLIGKGRRKDKDEQNSQKEEFELKLIKAKEAFNDETEANKSAMTIAKMRLVRQYKLVEQEDRLELSRKRPQLVKFIKEDFPIDPSMINSLLKVVERSKMIEEIGEVAPLNILLLQAHPHVQHGLINDMVASMTHPLGAVQYLPWTYKTATGNSMLLNLNVIMRDIPTLVISPRYIEDDKKLYFSAALWDSNADKHPYIRPLFSVDFDHKQLTDPTKQLELCNKIIFAATVISGCARDSYMLMNYGLPPTFPKLVEHNSWLKNGLTSGECNKITQFVFNEYRSNMTNLLIQAGKAEGDGKDDIEYLVKEAQKALSTLLLPQEN